MKDLRLAVRKEYFDQIKAGTKTRENRLANDYCNKRLKKVVETFDHNDTVTITCGYPKKNDKSRTLVFPYNGIILGEITHPHFGDKPILVHQILLMSVKQ